MSKKWKAKKRAKKTYQDYKESNLPDDLQKITFNFLNTLYKELFGQYHQKTSKANIIEKIITYRTRGLYLK